MILKAVHQWLTPVILATQEAEIRRIVAPYSKKNPIIKEGLLEWLEQ
jgi:hypothetical protein